MASVILLVLRDHEGNLRFLAHPDLGSTVQDEDRVYLQSLLQDFKERASLDPDSLFQHLSNLAVGPLVTRAVGADLEKCPALQTLSSAFTEL
jgi:predicted NAD/FAD-binding protein